jgi:hypothetical protein
MSIVNRRNAVVGFLAIKVGKRVARKQAKQAAGRLIPWGNKSDKKSDKKSEKQND